MSETRRGYVLGLAAWAMWGFFPLYWPLLKPADAVEILAHRILWSLVVIAVVVQLSRRGSTLRRALAVRRTRLLLFAAALLITTNWGTYIWGVNNGHVVETSLGYFINPLVSVVLGVLVLGERLRPWQWSAVALAGLAVVGLAFDYGRPPWVALVLAFSFGGYGLAKKKADTGAVESLAVETAVVAPVALAYVVFLTATGASTFGGHGAGHIALMLGTGLITVAPLLCFGAAATRIPLSHLGLMQYLTPTVQFILGLVVFDEQMTTARWLGFGAIWFALLVFTVEAFNHRRLQLRLTAESAAI